MKSNFYNIFIELIEDLVLGKAMDESKDSDILTDEEAEIFIESLKPQKYWEIKKSIKRLESQMNASTAYRAQELYLLKQYFKNPLVIAAAAVSSIGLGYFLARKGGIKLILRTLMGTSLFALRTVSNVRLISSLTSPKKDG